MTHFYLTLPSNASMKIYPDNTVAKYTTQLPNNKELDGDWEVALTEIQYPHKFYNVKGEWFRIFNNFKWGRKVYIKDDYYPTVESLLEEFKTEAEDEATEMRIDSFIFEDAMPRAGRVRMATDPGPYVVASRLLMNLYAKTRLSIGSETRMLFVYCDILEHVPVGDGLAPLLRAVVVRGKHGDRIGERFVDPMYLPIQKKKFGSIEINIMTDTGTPVPFIDGRSMVLLHFRRSNNPYFLQK